MKVNVKKNPEITKFFLLIIFYPFMMLFVVFLLESVFIRYDHYEYGLPYFLVWFISFLITFVISMTSYILEFETELKCVRCLNIFDKKEGIDLKHKKADNYYCFVCYPCLEKLKKSFEVKK